jgi:mono/diheme cytochrome c family protein
VFEVQQSGITFVTRIDRVPSVDSSLIGNNMIKNLLRSLFTAGALLSLSVESTSAQDSTQAASAQAQSAPVPGSQAAAPAGAADGDAAEGESIFKNNCASCHSTGAEKLVGPGLLGIDKRRSIDWIVKWVHNPQGMIDSGDEYAVKLWNAYKPTIMAAYPNLTDAQIKGIVAYVNQANAGAAGGQGTNENQKVGGTTTAAVSAQPSGFFNVILIALLVVMVLVLVALLTIVTLLGKLVQVDPTSPQAQTIPFFQRLKENAEKLAANPAFRTGALLLFLLIAGKASIDGMYGIGIHQGYAPKQPIQYSHKLHAGQYQIDCNYCHTGVNKGKTANIPSANICMNCHGVIKAGSPEIQKIYRAIEKNQPIEWVRVHNLPDLAYFNHAQHVNVGGLQCQQCHGEIEKMEVVEQRSSLTMGWCIDCHRETNVNAKGNAYYDKLVAVHQADGLRDLKVSNIGGLECSKCHY